jgi:hypothetical protein
MRCDEERGIFSKTLSMRKPLTAFSSERGCKESSGYV